MNVVLYLIRSPVIIHDRQSTGENLVPPWPTFFEMPQVCEYMDHLHISNCAGPPSNAQCMTVATLHFAGCPVLEPIRTIYT